MLIGVGLPTRQAASDPDLMRTWMTRADAGPFSSLAVTDRVVTDALEPLTVLAVAAGITRRVRLLTSVVIGPTRETTLLARQAASLDALSGGRLTLAIGVGARTSDYLATGTEFHTRGRRFDEQLARLRVIWRGEAVAGLGPLGPVPARPGGPELLIGGYVDAVVRRVVAWGDGYMAPGGAEPAAVSTAWARILAAWEEAGRDGRPRLVGGSYFGLGAGGEEAARAYIDELYGHDPALAARRLAGIPLTPRAVRGLIERQVALGTDELILRPCSADIGQLARLADLIG
jgi:alkanesulfonate monooxygenase SsuD/methylene tetrahydromethanopterin reductase-like flavin-dependent oxidoreductase (luciferase family)